jgi:hypothetical protein
VVLGEMGIYLQKKKNRLHTIYKNQLNIEDIDIKPEAIKPLEKKLREKLHGIGLDNFSFICLSA